MRELIKAIGKKLSYNIELISQLIVVISSAWIYGIIEAKYIPTDKMALPIMGRFSPYHVCLLILMAIISVSLALNNVQWLLEHKKKYIFLMCLAALPIALMIEDCSWFVTMWVPIKHDEWTLIWPGFGINLGFTWLPAWYIIVTAFSSFLYWLAGRYATVGYRSFLTKNVRIDARKDFLP